MRDHALTWTSPLSGIEYILGVGRAMPVIRGGDGTETTSTEGGTSTGTEGGTGASTEPDEGDKPTLSQNQVNAIVTRETAKATRGLIAPKDMGFDSAKELKEFLDTMKGKSEAEKTEEEKAREAAIKEAREAGKAEVLPKARELLLRAEFLVAAKDAGVAYPKDAYALAQANAMLSDIEVDDDGNVSGVEWKDFFEGMKKDKPFLFNEQQGSAGNIGAGASGRATGTREAELATRYPALARGMQPQRS